MKVFRLCLVMLLLSCCTSWAFAELDRISPVKTSITLHPGEKYSYDLIYKSGQGGVYDFSTREFSTDASGEKHYTSETSELVKVKQTVFEFAPNQERHIPIQVMIPEDLSAQDRNIAHFLRRRSEERQTFELGSLMLLRIENPPHLNWIIGPMVQLMVYSLFFR